jgi:glutamine amidotransferase-like uncharacterized protein
MPKKKTILVYVENPMCSIDCADGVVDSLDTSIYNIKLVGPGSVPKLKLTQDLLESADIFVVPGGTGDADKFHKSKLKAIGPMLKSYIHNGGRYLGICMGAYFAGDEYFNILSEKTNADRYVEMKDASVKHDKHAVVSVTWKGKQIDLYFHDGTVFTGDKLIGEIVATYSNGAAAALIQSSGRGKIGVIGPHPEAQKWWFYVKSKIKNRWIDCTHKNLLSDFVKMLLRS